MDARAVTPPRATHVLLPEAILARSPSLEDGVSASVEADHRFWGCELIEEAGILLRLPQVVMATAQTTLHRFYYRKSLRTFDAFRVAFGCLFVAAKIEERPKRIKDVLSVFYAVYRRRKWGATKLRQQLLDLESDSYYLWRDWLIMVERQILIDLGFSLYTIMEHPHKYILYYIKILDGSKALAQKAWGYLNDSLRIDLCVRFRAEVIACAAIFLASRMLQVKLPDSPHWFELFDVQQEEMLCVAKEIMALYKRPKIVWLDALTEIDPFAVNDYPDDEAIQGEPSAGEMAASPPAEAAAAVSSVVRAETSNDMPTPSTRKHEAQVMRSHSPLVAITKDSRRSGRGRSRSSSPDRDRRRRESSEREDRRDHSRHSKRGRSHSRDRKRSRRSRSRSRSHSHDRRRHRHSRRRSASRSRSRSRSRGRRR